MTDKKNAEMEDSRPGKHKQERLYIGAGGHIPPDSLGAPDSKAS